MHTLRIKWYFGLALILACRDRSIGNDNALSMCCDRKQLEIFARFTHRQAGRGISLAAAYIRPAATPHGSTAHYLSLYFKDTFPLKVRCPSQPKPRGL